MANTRGTKRWSEAEDQALEYYFTRYPVTLAIERYITNQDPTWPERSHSAIRKRAYNRKLAQAERGDYFTIAQLARELSLTRAVVKGWYYEGAYNPRLKVTRIRQKVITRKAWVQEFICPHEIRDSRSYQLPHRFHALDGVSDETVDWLFNGDKEILSAFHQYRESLVGPDHPLTLQELSDRLGIPRYRVAGWRYRCHPALEVEVEEVGKAHRVYSTADKVVNFLSTPPDNMATTIENRYHLVRDAHISGLRWLFQSRFDSREELNNFLRDVINTVNPVHAAGLSPVLKRSSIDDRVIFRYSTATEAAKFNFISVATVTRSIRSSKPPQGLDFYFDRPAPLEKSLAFAELAECRAG